MKHWAGAVLTALMLINFICGCSEGDERHHPLFRQGEIALSNGHALEALQHFHALLKRRPNGVYTHLRLASVYDELLDDPLNALLHYNCYLSAFPNAPDAAEVEAWKLRAEKRCYEMLKQRFEAPAGEAEDNAETNGSSALSENTASDNTNTQSEPVAVIAGNTPENPSAAAQEPAEKAPENAAEKTPAVPATPAVSDDQSREIAELKEQLARFQARYRFMQMELERLRALQKTQAGTAAGTIPSPASAAESNAEASAEADSSGVRKYTVQAGDTPGRIARKFYGKSSLYNHIMQANPQVDARRMRPGTVLVIPPKPAN